MRGKWAAGIPPRNFTWIVKDQLAVSERPGGSAPSHRRVRRQEEIIWLRVQGFDHVISLLPSPHNLAAYEEGGISSSHFPLVAGADALDALRDLYRELDRRLNEDERLLLHQDELGDRVMGVVGGYLIWSGRLPGGPQSIAVVERLVGRQMGPPGRDLVAEVVTLGPHGSLAPHTRSGRAGTVDADESPQQSKDEQGVHNGMASGESSAGAQVDVERSSSDHSARADL